MPLPQEVATGDAGLWDFKETPALLVPAPSTQARDSAWNPTISSEVGCTQGPEFSAMPGPPTWPPASVLSGDVWPTGPARKQQMDGQYGRVGSEPEARNREGEVPGSGESHSRKAALPDRRQDREYWSCLRHGSHTAAHSVRKYKELEGSGSLWHLPRL